MVKMILMVGIILMLLSSNATAQGRLAVGHCVADLRKFCPGVPPGDNALRDCMREHIREVSFPCLVTLAEFAEVRGSRNECSAHLQQQCAGVERGGGQFGACLRSAVASLSDTCKDALARSSPPRSLMVTSAVDDNVGFGSLSTDPPIMPGSPCPLL